MNFYINICFSTTAWNNIYCYLWDFRTFLSFIPNINTFLSILNPGPRDECRLCGQLAGQPGTWTGLFYFADSIDQCALAPLHVVCDVHVWCMSCIHRNLYQPYSCPNLGTSLCWLQKDKHERGDACTKLGGSALIEFPGMGWSSPFGLRLSFWLFDKKGDHSFYTETP